MKFNLNKEYKRRWIYALRSGEYKQTKLSLCDSVGYCCLGVLCMLNALRFEKSLSIGLFYNDELYDLKNSTYLRGEDINVLANMNDCGKTFDEIADYIEENL